MKKQTQIKDKEAEQEKDFTGKPVKLRRKVIQIAVGHRQDENNEVIDGDRIWALCDDGTIWYNEMDPQMDEWVWWTPPTVPQGPRQDIGDAFEREADFYRP
jgi:hypothetical protein